MAPDTILHRPRLQVSHPFFAIGDAVDLTLAVGSHNGQLTTRNLVIAAQRRNKYTGRPEYKLHDHALNRIDYTRWFEETHLHHHDPSVPDPVCRRPMKSGRACTSTPLQPSRLCIKHKAKLELDRERARQKLEVELERRKVPRRKGTRQSIFLPSPNSASTTTAALPRYQEAVTTPAHLEHLAGIDTDTATAMWGEVDLFATVAARGPRLPTKTPTSPPPLHRRTCVILIALCAATVTVSLSVAIWWSVTAGHVSGGFTMAGYIAALGGIVMFPVQSAHGKNCLCWVGRGRGG